PANLLSVHSGGQLQILNLPRAIPTAPARIDTLSLHERSSDLDKRHDHVIRDVRRMLTELQQHAPDLGHQFSEQRDGRGYTSQFLDRKSTRLNSSHVKISYAVICLKKKTSKYSVATAWCVESSN